MSCRGSSRSTCLFTGAILLGMMLSAPTQAEEAVASPAADQRVITGEIVDPASYLKTGGRGAEAEEQTYAAVDGGQSLALLEEGTNTLYLLLAEQAGEDPNELAYDYVNQQVRATGRLYERGGLKGFVASAIDPAVPLPAAAASAPAASEDH